MNRRMKLKAARAEKKQQRIEAGLVSEVFPEVKEIVISMMYSQTGVLQPLSRMVNFAPGSFALFKVNCLCSECPEGGFNFSKIIRSMVRNTKNVSKGKINCDSCSVPECTGVDYIVKIKYSHK